MRYKHTLFVLLIITMKHVGAATIISTLLVLLLGCTPAATGEHSQEEQMDALESRIEQLAGTLGAQQGLSDSATDERLAIQAQIGELARRIADDEFDRFDGQEKGLLAFDAGLQACLKEMEQRPDQSYLVEDVVFLPDFASFQPDIRVGLVWQFTIRGPAGRFIVTIDASSGGLVFKNRIGDGE